MKKIIVILLGLSLSLCLPPFASAIDVNFQWGASTGIVDGYRIYYGDSKGGPYSKQLCEVNGTTLNYKADLDGTLEYYLICRAFNSYGKSGNSNEVHWNYTVPGIPGNLIWSIDLTELIKNLGAEQIKFISK